MSARRKIRLATVPVAAGVILMTLAAALPAAAGTFSYTGSLQLAQGTYTYVQAARGLYFFNGFSFNSESFTLTATIPLIYQSTPYMTYTGVGALPVPVQVQQFGLGDPLVFAGVRLWKEGAAVPSVMLSAQAKFPLASLESGFGTGSWDYGGGLSFAKSVGGVFLFADVSYWVLGDLPELVILDPWVFALSLGVPLSRGKSSLLFSYLGMTEVIEATAPPSSVGLGLSFKVGSKSSLMLSGLIGLSETSPDFSVSFGWSLGF